MRAILADIEDRLKDWSPAARGMKAPLDGAGAQGATSCLCCDSRVRSVRDLQVRRLVVGGGWLWRPVALHPCKHVLLLHSVLSCICFACIGLASPAFCSCSRGLAYKP